MFNPSRRILLDIIMQVRVLGLSDRLRQGWARDVDCWDHLVLRLLRVVEGPVFCNLALKARFVCFYMFGFSFTV